MLKKADCIRYMLLISLLFINVSSRHVEITKFDIVPNFLNIKDINERKSAFFNFLIPIVQRENESIRLDRQKIEKLKEKKDLSNFEFKRLSIIAGRYGKFSGEVKVGVMIDELLKRANILPVDLVLAQAATESAWGRSRFATENLNFFGEQCYRKGCGTIPSRRRTKSSVEIKKFKSARESVSSYFYIINTKKAYRKFREIRAGLVRKNKHLSSYELANGLIHYSERGMSYVRDIKRMIRQNRSLIKSLT